ncbi:MAG: hypothetical protein ABI024_03620 [Vicinamibacterales bacterium]
MRAANAFLAIATLALLGSAAWQHMRINSLAADLEQSRRELSFKVEKLSNEKLQSHREELVGAVAFLDDLYRSADGLQRPGGLYSLDAQKVDAEAIGTWILDVYLKARIDGKTDAEARQAIADAIQSSDEWRRKHQGVR